MEQARGNMQTHHNVLQKAMEKGATGLDKEPQPTMREKVQSESVPHKSPQPFPPCQRGGKEQRKSSQKTLAL